MKTIHTLIIPDIHGRLFWKSALDKFPKDKYPDLTIVFLGDYLDPYEFEGISKEDAIINFEDILYTAKNDNRIHLLIGNHDMHYFYDARFKSRVDYEHYNDIKSMFEDDMNLFNVAYEEIVNGEKYLYTHAGVSSFWLKHLQFVGKNAVKANKEYHIDRLGNKVKKVSDEQLPFCKMLADMTPDADKLNKMLHNFQGQANLWMASWARGGDYQNGSCIWEDWSEWQYKGMEIEGMWQIFGHSRWSKKDPDNASIDTERKLACIDTAYAWVLYDDGTLEGIVDDTYSFEKIKNNFKRG